MPISPKPIALQPSSAALLQLEKLARGETSVEAAADALGLSGSRQSHDPQHFQTVDGARVDLGRRARCGFGEVIFGEGKSAELITTIVNAQLAAGECAFVTRVDPTVAAQVRRGFDHTTHNAQAHTLRVDVDASGPSPDAGDDEIHVAVVTAGSTDLPVAEEALETLDWMGVARRRFDDVGVAGPARLLSIVPELIRAEAVVVVAGMEGALASVVGGHVAVPVFAVPTSVGYGANLGGMTPLLGMLSSCAANVAVVNVDAGFKAAYLAGLVASRIKKALATDMPTSP